MLISVSWIVDTCRLKELLGKWKKSFESVWSSANLSWSICAHWGWVVFCCFWVLWVLFFNMKPFNKDLELQGFWFGFFSVFLFWGFDRYTCIHRTSKDSRLVLGFLLVLKLIKLAKSTCLLFYFSLVNGKTVNVCRNWDTNYVVT